MVQLLWKDGDRVRVGEGQAEGGSLEVLGETRGVLQAEGVRLLSGRHREVSVRDGGRAPSLQCQYCGQKALQGYSGPGQEEEVMGEVPRSQSKMAASHPEVGPSLGLQCLLCPSWPHPSPCLASIGEESSGGCSASENAALLWAGVLFFSTLSSCDIVQGICFSLMKYRKQTLSNPSLTKGTFTLTYLLDFQ